MHRREASVALEPPLSALLSYPAEVSCAEVQARMEGQCLKGVGGRLEVGVRDEVRSLSTCLGIGRLAVEGRGVAACRARGMALFG